MEDLSSGLGDRCRYPPNLKPSEMISIRHMLFAIFVIAFTLGSIFEIRLSLHAGSIVATAYLLFFACYCCYSAIKSVHTPDPDRQFWIGSTITLAILFVAIDDSILTDFTSLPDLLRTAMFEDVKIDSVEDLAAARGPFVMIPILKNAFIILASIFGGAFAKWLYLKHNESSDM